MIEYFDSLIHDTIIFRVAVICFSLVLVLTPPKLTKKGVLIFLGQFVALMLVRHLCGLLLYVIFDNEYTIIILEGVVNILLGFAYALLFCKYELGIKLLLTGSLIAVITEIVNLSHIFGAYVDEETTANITIPLLIVIYALILVFAIVETKYSIAELISVPKGAIILFTLSDIVGIAVSISLQCISIFGSTEFRLYSSAIYTLLYFFSFVAYVSVYMTSKESTKAHQMQIENTLLSASNQQLELVKNNIQELRLLRHDLKNKYTYIQTLCQQKQYEKLEEFVSSFSTDTFRSLSYISCGNYEISAILTMESSKAISKKMSLDCEVMVPPTLNYSQEDICSLLTNLIDNAIEAQERYQIYSPIKVRVLPRNKQLYICIINKIPKGMDNRKLLSLNSSKEDKSEHGYGTKIIKHIANKYNGDVFYDIQEDNFIVDVLMDLVYEKKGEQHE